MEAIVGKRAWCGAQHKGRFPAIGSINPLSPRQGAKVSGLLRGVPVFDVETWNRVCQKVVVVGDQRGAGSDGLGRDHQIDTRAPLSSAFKMSTEMGQVFCGGQIERKDRDPGDGRVDLAAIDLDMGRTLRPIGARTRRWRS